MRRLLLTSLVAGLVAAAAVSAADEPSPEATEGSAVRTHFRVTAASGSKIPTAGTTVLLRRRSRTSGCAPGPRPDRSCSPGAYYAKLTKKVICSATFRTGDYRRVPDSEKRDVEVEYGLEPKPYGSALEIDHIVSLELGGSNDIANLFPERADAAPGYRVKDLLENKVHDLVCSGRLSLRTARRQIASDWEALYTRTFGTEPTG